jgi:hypothetical protein
MKNYNNLDGENIELDGVTNEDMSFHDQFNDADDFYPFQGEPISMIAASAAQNTPDYFDQENFYPLDGDYSEARGRRRSSRSKKGTILDKRERARRREGRQEMIKTRMSAKNEEIKSRAALNREIGKESPADAELAKSLAALSMPLTPTANDGTTTSTGMSKTTKILIGVGSVLVLGLVGFLIYRKYKK